jgi:cytochrome P450
MHKAFTPRIIEQLRTRIQAIADDLLDAVEAKGHMDVIADFAFPLPIIVIGDLLGIPVKDHENFRTWAANQMAAADMGASLETMKRGSQSFADFHAYVKSLIEVRRQAPQEDLLSALIAAESEGHKLTEEEMISATNVILLAGHETTATLIGNGLVALLKNPVQLDLLKANSSLLESAVEEMLRYDSPAQFMARVATEDIEIGGQVIPQGQKVALMIASANRDESIFEQADEFDIQRQPNPHIAFGLGAHFCLGAPLARLEGQIAFATLLRRLPNLHMDTNTLTYRPAFRVRGLASLPVTF